jgi:urea transporter
MATALDINILRVAQALVLVLGGVVVYFASRAYRKTRSKSMAFLTLGFLFVTFGAVLAGVLFEFMNMDIVEVQVAQAASQVAGFAFIVYSLAGAKD